MKVAYILLPLILCVCAAAPIANADLYIVPDSDETTPNVVTLPEVNSENCKVENVKKLKDSMAQQEFARLCIRRGEMANSQPKSW